MGDSTISAETCITFVSGSSSEPKCFLENTLFRLMTGEFIQAQTVRPGMEIQSAFGAPLMVQEMERFSPVERTLVRLSTGVASHLLTDDHRVLVRRVSGIETAPARSLRG